MKRRLWPVVALVLLPSAARAADPPRSGGDPAAAQTLFYEARNLMQQKRFAEACPKLEESLRLDAGLGTQFNLADCNEHIGKIASAWAGFLDVAGQATAKKQLDRETVARRRATALEPRLPRLVVEVNGAPEGLEVKRDGIVIGAAAWGTAIPVDPGSHKVTATAPDREPWETTLQSTEGKTARVAVSLVRRVPTVPAVPAPIAAAPNGNGAPDLLTRPGTTTTTMSSIERAETFPPPVVESSGGTQRAVGWVVMGLGVVGVGVGAGFGLSSLRNRNESRDHCDGDACDARGVGLRDDAIRNGNIATLSVIAGGAAIAGGLAIVLTAPKSGPESRAGQLRAVPNVAIGGGGLTLQGTFQ